MSKCANSSILCLPNTQIENMSNLLLTNIKYVPPYVLTEACLHCFIMFAWPSNSGSVRRLEHVMGKMIPLFEQLSQQ